MSGFMVQHKGRFVTIPFEEYPVVPSVEGRLPDTPVLTMDERKFASATKGARWVAGKGGEYVLLAHCGELTLSRWETLEEAARWKNAIDHGGCGGSCYRAHMIVRVDPKNSREAERERLICIS